LLFQYDLKDYWVREYEKGEKARVKPRESLQRVYQYTVAHGELPEVFCKSKKKDKPAVCRLLLSHNPPLLWVEMQAGNSSYNHRKSVQFLRMFMGSGTLSPLALAHKQNHHHHWFSP